MTQMYADKPATPKQRITLRRFGPLPGRPCKPLNRRDLGGIEKRRFDPTRWPLGVRTCRFTARLPRYLVAALKCLVEENGESAGALLTRELHGLAYAHRERLGASIAGFAEAVNWPLSEDTTQG